MNLSILESRNRISHIYDFFKFKCTNKIPLITQLPHIILMLYLIIRIYYNYLFIGKYCFNALYPSLIEEIGHGTCRFSP